MDWATGLYSVLGLSTAPSATLSTLACCVKTVCPHKGPLGTVNRQRLSVRWMRMPCSLCVQFSGQDGGSSRTPVLGQWKELWRVEGMDGERPHKGMELAHTSACLRLGQAAGMWPP